MTEDILLPSGSKLKVTLAPFVVARALYQAVLEELKTFHIDGNDEFDINFFKDLFCTGFSSKKIEGCLDECLKRVLYNDRKVTLETWDDVKAREDYFDVLLEVARVNLAPFTRNLLSRYQGILENVDSFLKSSRKTQS